VTYKIEFDGPPKVASVEHHGWTIELIASASRSGAYIVLIRVRAPLETTFADLDPGDATFESDDKALEAGEKRARAHIDRLRRQA
jgi:hypothetical protein